MKKRERKPKGKKGKDSIWLTANFFPSMNSSYYHRRKQNSVFGTQIFGICLVTKILKGDLDQLLIHSGRLQSI